MTYGDGAAVADGGNEEWKRYCGDDDVVANGYIAGADAVGGTDGGAQGASVEVFVAADMGGGRVCIVFGGIVADGAGQFEWFDGCG